MLQREEKGAEYFLVKIYPEKFDPLFADLGLVVARSSAWQQSSLIEAVEGDITACHIVFWCLLVLYMF